MSWLLYQGAFAVDEIHLTPLYGSLLSALWRVSDGQITNFVYSARALSFFLFSVTTLYLTLILKEVFFKERANGWFYALIIGTLFSIYLAAVRGFEIRPEALGNFLYLFGASFLIFGNIQSKGHSFLLYSISIITLCIASFVTIRHSIPAIFLALASTIALYRNINGPGYGRLFVESTFRSDSSLVSTESLRHFNRGARNGPVRLA